MKIVDANVLLHAADRESPQHAASREWLDRSLSGGRTVGFTWGAMLASLRLSTRYPVFRDPLSIEEAGAQLADWLSAPGAVMLEPSGMHLHTLTKLLGEAGTAGNLVQDAHLAAIAFENGAEIVSYDKDFDRFPDAVRYEP